MPKNWCFWTVVLEKTLQSPSDCKEMKPKGNQSWIFIGKIDAEAETPILLSPDVKNWLIGKDPDAGKDWRQEKGTTQDEMVGWHHRLDGHEFVQGLGVGEGQESLKCCSPWVIKSWTQLSNWTEKLIITYSNIKSIGHSNCCTSQLFYKKKLNENLKRSNFFWRILFL